MIRQYLSASGCVVSMQNCINEERIASVVGWGRTVGCVVGGGVGKGNRHIQLPQRTPVGNLWLSVAHRYGSVIDSIGESTGTVDLF